MIIKNIETVKLEIRTHLKDYLKSQGRRLDGNSCQCPNGKEHKNDDLHLSCGIDPTGNVFHCMQCEKSGDIFTAANLLENKPITGEEFITENFMYLARMLNIQYETEEMTEEEKRLWSVYMAYDKMKDILHKNFFLHKEAQEYVKTRGWESLTETFEFGACDSGDKLMGLLEKDVSKEVIKDAGLSHKDLFAGRLIFPIKDASGRVCAFGSRSLAGNGRYINSKNHLCYDKSSTLFNLHNARKASSTVYIVEGYADCLTIFKHGIHNVVAVGGTAFTMKQYEMLVRAKITRLVLCFDNDEPGKSALDRTLLNVIGNKKDFIVCIKEMVDAKDPDEFIVKYGIDKFKALAEHTVFEWRANKFIASPSDALRGQVLEDILNETSFIERDRMCDKLAKDSGIRIETLQKEINRLEELKKEHLDITTTDIIREETEFEMKVNEYEEWVFSRKDELLGIHCGFDFLTNNLDGIQNALYLIGGRPNVGKSAFCFNMAYNIAVKNEDVFVLFWSIDDNLRKVIPRLIAAESQIPINIVSNPLYKLTEGNGYSKEEARKIMERRETAVNKLKLLSKRILIKDISSGGSIEAIEKSVKMMRAVTKADGTKLVLFIDNFHKLSTEAHASENIRVKTMNLSEQVKKISNLYGCPVITTVELGKHGERVRPIENDIMETVQLSYDADCIMLVHNEFHRVADQSTMFFEDELGARKPILEVNIAKNKTSGFKGNTFFRFFPEYSLLTECSGMESRKLKGILNAEPIDIPKKYGGGGSTYTKPSYQYKDA